MLSAHWRRTGTCQIVLEDVFTNNLGRFIGGENAGTVGRGRGGTVEPMDNPAEEPVIVDVDFHLSPDGPPLVWWPTRAEMSARASSYLPGTMGWCCWRLLMGSMLPLAPCD